MGAGGLKFSWENIGSPALWVPVSFFSGFFLRNAVQIYADVTGWARNVLEHRRRLKDPYYNIIFAYTTFDIVRINPYWIHVDEDNKVLIRGYEAENVRVHVHRALLGEEQKKIDHQTLRNHIKRARMTGTWILFGPEEVSINSLVAGMHLWFDGLSAGDEKNKDLVNPSKWSKSLDRKYRKNKKEAEPFEVDFEA